MTSQAQKAGALRALHVPGDPLVLVNVWDAASAGAVAALPGVRALATASHAIADVLGYEDGEQTPLDEMIAAVGRIAGAVDLPLTADLEGGYGDAADTMVRAIAVGAVGLNLEDTDHAAGAKTLVPQAAHAAAVAAVRAAGDAVGVAVVINARTDVFLRGVGDDDDARLTLAAERGNAYLAAGADCIFVPGVRAIDTITAVVRAIEGPVSVIAGPGSPGVAELAAAGVARISTGPYPHIAAIAALTAAATQVYEEGSFAGL
jgi:2-methylisocitrate lyase-like PEP mutase family enzyme